MLEKLKELIQISQKIENIHSNLNVIIVAYVFQKMVRTWHQVLPQIYKEEELETEH